jgi:hypothetical protein
LPTWTGALLTVIGTQEPGVDAAGTPEPVAVGEASEAPSGGGPGASSPAGVTAGDVPGGDVAGVVGDPGGPGPIDDTDRPPDPGDGAPSAPASATDAPGDGLSPMPSGTQPAPGEPPSPSPIPTPRPTSPPPPTSPPTPAPTPPPQTPPAEDGAPTVAFGVTVDGLTARFANRTKGAVSWTWQFGDGETSTARNPSHTYAAPGTYTVTLVAFARDGSSASRAETINVGG